MKLIPLEDRVTLIQDEAIKETPTGLAIPETAQQKPKMGTIVAVGPGKPNYPMAVKTGDRVLFVPYAGTEVEHEGKKYLIMRMSDLIAII